MLIDEYSKGVKIIAEDVISIYTIRFREDGILHGHVASGGKWDPEDYRQLFPAIGKMVNFRKVPVMITYDKFVFPSSESAAYWADPETTCPYFSSEALVMESLPLKILGNFYTNFRKPARPTKIFADEKEAVAWLKTFL